jgi:hypothetical protein
MSDTETQDSPLRAAHTKAAAIVDELLLEGAPIVSFSTFGDGSKVEFVFYKPDGLPPVRGVVWPDVKTAVA